MDLKKSFEQVSEIIKNNENFLIITHIFPDGDALGSTTALYSLLAQSNKNVFMICENIMSILPHYNYML